MKISLCMIVKNEEKTIGKVLESVKEYVDEIIVVDTGSIDGTKDILGQYLDQIYEFDWCNDFAAARNYAIEQASNEWILTLDADEVVENCDMEEIRHIIKNEPKIVGRLKCINILNDKTGERKYIERVSRLFNKRYNRYEGIIHEQIVAKDRSKYTTKHIPLTVTHTGYTQEVLDRTNKTQRNIGLLKKALEESPFDNYLNYQLGKSYFLAKKYHESTQYFENSFVGSLNYKLEYVEDLVESYGYALINTQQFEKSMTIKQYESYYKRSADFKFLIGLIMMNNGFFEESISYFKSCLKLDEGNLEGVTSYLANYNIGVVLEGLGKMDEALNHYFKCGSYALAVNRISTLLNWSAQKIEEKNIDGLKELLTAGYLKTVQSLILEKQDGEMSIELSLLLGVVYLINESYKEAEEQFMDVLSKDEKNTDCHYNLGYLYEISGRNEKASHAYKNALRYTDDEIMRKELEVKINMLM